MTKLETTEYEKFSKSDFGYKELPRGLIAVSGREAVQFLNGLITNDIAKLEEGTQMSAAFPNAQGRLLALVRVLRRGDSFLFETEVATREKVFQNLFRFTYAGDFFVEDLSEKYKYFEVQSPESRVQSLNFEFQDLDSIVFESRQGADYFVLQEKTEDFKVQLKNAVEISEELYEVLRIENGEPLYGVDIDETTIVPETGVADVISYNKGCYIGQEIIARIHFRGHIAKQLTGLILNEAVQPNDELKSLDGKNAGRVTSVTFSPKLEKFIALAFVRYDYLAEGTELKVNETTATIKNLPFVELSAKML